VPPIFSLVGQPTSCPELHSVFRTPPQTPPAPHSHPEFPSSTAHVLSSTAPQSRILQSFCMDPRCKLYQPTSFASLMNQPFDIILYFCNYRNMTTATRRASEKIVKYADMFSAMGTEARLRIMQLLLSAHPDGLVVGEIQEELDIPNSTLSHHLDKLRAEDLVNVRRESTFLRYTANTDAIQEVLQFLYAECCTRNNALKPESITCCK